MESFLKLIAHDLYQRFGNNLSSVAVVFPNKRAGLFFNEYLAAQSAEPIWAPSYFSINDLMKQLSPLEQGDPIKLVCELYKIYVQQTQSEEPLDDFYFWGELLISDFDDIDKNMVEAEKLFVNLKELKEISTDFSFLTPEQEEAIRQFFLNFSIEKQTVLKERFMIMWDTLGDVYREFKKTLTHQGIAYEGMLYRAAVDTLDTDALPYDTYVFAGFNILSKVERKLFKAFKTAGKSLFYWDYDSFYLNINNHEAGQFIRQNLIEFPSPLPAHLFDNLNTPRQITYIAAPTENAQARYLPQWIRRHIGEKEAETAVVLCNESLLLPVIHAIPEEVNSLNITMGFPLSQTPVCGFINTLLDLQTNGFKQKSGKFSLRQINNVLNHPYAALISKKAIILSKELTENNRFSVHPSELRQDEQLALLFTPQPDNQALCTYLMAVMQALAAGYKQNSKNEYAFDQLYQESIFKSYTILARINTLIEQGDLHVNTETFRRLLTKLFASLNIPFHGEPAVGMQVMGVLETRGLDFRNLIMISVNEGKMPQSGGNASFVPYNLRKAFGMSLVEEKNAVYAYYFYRLMQRAENITLLYNTSTDKLNRGEWSRYMLQFLIEWPHPIHRFFLQAGQAPQETHSLTVNKTTEVMKQLQARFDIRVRPSALLSPSALNTYLNCPMQFYFYYVAELQPPTMLIDEIDSPTFGNIFHYAAELTYQELTARDKLIRREDLEKLLKDEVKLKGYVDKAFKKHFFKLPDDEQAEYNGMQLISAEVIYTYLRQLLRNDLIYAPFCMEAMEKSVSEEVSINTPKGAIKARIGGNIDRMDSKEGVLRIVDYKTGGTAASTPTLESLFIPSPTRAKHVFQTFLYASIVVRRQTMKVAPSLLYIHQAASESYSPVIQIGQSTQKEPVEDFSLYADKFRQHLQVLMEEIFNPEIPFTQTTVDKNCEYCDFKMICRK